MTEINLADEEELSVNTVSRATISRYEKILNEMFSDNEETEVLTVLDIMCGKPRLWRNMPLMSWLGAVSV